MSLVLTAEEQSLRDSVRRFVAERSALPAIRELIAAGEPYDPGVWKQLAGQLGLASLIIPEEYGGAEAGHSALTVALAELGAGLVPSPLLASAVLAAGALLHLDDEAARSELLPGIASGELLATLAITGGPRGLGEPGAAGGHVAATGSGDAVTLTGELAPVLNGAQASVLLVPAAGAETVRDLPGRRGRRRPEPGPADHRRPHQGGGPDRARAHPGPAAGRATRAARWPPPPTWPTWPWPPSRTAPWPPAWP